MNQKTTMTTLLCRTFAIPVTGVMLHIAQAHHAWVVLSHYVHGRAGNCTIAKSFQGEALSRLQSQNVDQLHAQSRIVRAEDTYSLWSTPMGEFWVPTASGLAILYDPGEQKRNKYGDEGVHGGIGGIDGELQNIVLVPDAFGIEDHPPIRDFRRKRPAQALQVLRARFDGDDLGGPGPKRFSGKHSHVRPGVQDDVSRRDPKLVADAYDGYTVSKTCLCANNAIVPEVAFFY